MNADDRTLLTNFLRDLVNTRGGPKDAEADDLVHQALAANPDAAYLLVQHAIVADQSLHAAQARIADLENQVRAAQSAPQPQSAPGFAPQAPSPWGSPPPGQGYAQPYAQPYAQQYAPPPPAQRPGIFSGGGGLGSFLRTAGTTAAGVAGGELLFSGLSDLFGGNRGGGGFGGGFGGGGGGFGGQGENVTINNYNDGGSSDDDGDDNSDDSSDDSDT